MERYKIILKKFVVPMLLNILLAISCLFIGYYYGSQSNITKALETFDHSVCQYPYRTSNPVDGCDNSDPACPLEIKGGSCENYQPTEKELEPWVPEPAPKATEPVVTPTPIVTCK